MVSLAPVMVSCAWSPVLIKPTEVASTVTFAIQELVLITSIWALDVLDVDVAAPRPLVLAPPVLAPLLEELELPETDSPTVRLTAATAPFIGDVIVAEASWSCADASWLFAAVSLTVGESVSG